MRSLLVLVLFVVATPTLFAQTDSPSRSPNPGKAAKKKKAPAKYWVRFETSKGNVVIEVNRKWAPIGADHFHKLVKNGYYNEARFFRVIPGFMAQFGLAGDPELTAKNRTRLRDDPVRQSNLEGYITYAKTGQPNSRTTQLFINTGNNSRLDADGFAPFGKVVSGLSIIKDVESKYREQPVQGMITQLGNAYLKESFPDLDYIKKAVVLKKYDKDKDANKPPVGNKEAATDGDEGKKEAVKKDK